MSASRPSRAAAGSAAAAPASSSASARRANDGGDGGGGAASSQRAARPRGRRGAAAADDEEDVREEDEEVEARGRATSSSKRTRGAALPAPGGGGGAAAQLPFSTQRGLGIDSALELPGAPVAAVTYKLSDAAREAEGRTDPSDLERYVDGTMRLVLAYQSTKQPISGSEIRKTVLTGKSDKEAKELMPVLRFHCSRKFKDVFGYDLVAGEDAAGGIPLKEPWTLLNGLRSDEVNLALNEGASRGTNVGRAALMLTLGVLMLHDGAIRETELVDELKRFGFVYHKKSAAASSAGGADGAAAGDQPRVEGAEYIADYLRDWTKQGFLTKGDTGIVSEDKETTYAYGPKTLREIGKRAVLQFLVAATGERLGVSDERDLLGLRR